jgi:adenine/guanine phosphoribosyltransferase-like PRPP-binding protein
VGVGLALSLEAGEWFSQHFNVIVGRAISGAILGVLVGSMTGLPFIRDLKWSELTRL